MNIFFTSDTHFGHANIIGSCHRPYGTVEEMDEALTDNWNKRVKKNDLIYVLGDFAWRNHLDYLKNLNGKKVLIRGNHDKMPVEALERFTKVSPLEDLKIDKKRITLCHYPMYSWNASCHNTWHAFGHVHNNGFTHPRLGINVGVDVMGYKPIAWDELRKMFESLEERYTKEERDV